MFPNSVLFFYNFIGILNTKICTNSDVKSYKFLKIISIIRVILFSSIILAFALSEDFNNYFYTKDVTNTVSKWSNFTQYFVTVVSKLFFVFGIIPLVLQFFKCKEINEHIKKHLDFEEDAKFVEKLNKKINYNFILNFIIFLFCTLSRWITTVNFNNLWNIPLFLTFIQIPIVYYAMIGLNSDIHNFFLLAYEENYENFSKMEVGKFIEKLEKLDNLLRNFEKVFGTQLSLMTFCYTTSSICYVLT